VKCKVLNFCKAVPKEYGRPLWESLRHENVELFKWWVLGSRKTRGMGAGRKLKNHRRAQKWADKSYKKSHQGNEWKKPFAGSSHAKGIVLEKM